MFEVLSWVARGGVSFFFFFFSPLFGDLDWKDSYLNYVSIRQEVRIAASKDNKNGEHEGGGRDQDGDDGGKTHVCSRSEYGLRGRYGRQTGKAKGGGHTRLTKYYDDSAGDRFPPPPMTNQIVQGPSKQYKGQLNNTSEVNDE